MVDSDFDVSLTPINNITLCADQKSNRGHGISNVSEFSVEAFRDRTDVGYLYLGSSPSL